MLFMKRILLRPISSAFMHRNQNLITEGECFSTLQGDFQSNTPDMSLAGADVTSDAEFAR